MQKIYQLKGPCGLRMTPEDEVEKMLGTGFKFSDEKEKARFEKSRKTEKPASSKKKAAKKTSEK